MPNLEIVVKKPEQSDDVSKSVGETPASKTEQGIASAKQKAINAAIIGAGKQVILSGIAQYGNITGDYTLGRTISETTQIVGDILMIAKGGPIGMIAVASRHTMNMVSKNAEMNNRRIEIDLARERAGAISKKGSRY